MDLDVTSGGLLDCLLPAEVGAAQVGVGQVVGPPPSTLSAHKPVLIFIAQGCFLFPLRLGIVQVKAAGLSQ